MVSHLLTLSSCFNTVFQLDSPSLMVNMAKCTNTTNISQWGLSVVFRNILPDSLKKSLKLWVVELWETINNLKWYLWQILNYLRLLENSANVIHMNIILCLIRGVWSDHSGRRLTRSLKRAYAGCPCDGAEHTEYNTLVPCDDSTTVLFSLVCERVQRAHLSLSHPG